MSRDKSPLDVDETDHRPGRDDPPRRRPGRVFGDPSPEGTWSTAAGSDPDRKKWSPGAHAPGRDAHEGHHATPTKLEITTPLEWLLAGAAVGFFGFAFVLFIEGAQRSSPATPFDPRLPVTLAAAGAFFLFLWTQTDNYYITNPSRRRIDYHFKCFSLAWTTPRLEGRDVEIVAVDCVEKSRKQGKYGPRVYWKEYTVYAWLRGGGWLTLTDAIKDDLLTANQLAREAAAALGCPFGPGEVGIIYRRDESGRVVAVDISDDWFGFKRYPPWVFAATLAAMLVGLGVLLASMRMR